MGLSITTSACGRKVCSKMRQRPVVVYDPKLPTYSLPPMASQERHSQRDFNPDQPRDPDGKFASGGGDKQKEASSEGTLYHGTAGAYADSIREKGLLANQEYHRSDVYATNGLSTALYYATIETRAWAGDNEPEFPGKTGMALLEAKDQWLNALPCIVVEIDSRGFENVLGTGKLGDYFASHETVPPERIKSVKVYTYAEAKKLSEERAAQPSIYAVLTMKQLSKLQPSERSLCPACDSGDCVRHQLSIEQLGGEKMALRGWISWPSFEARFSEDQPRDPDGKFAGGGGSLPDAYAAAAARQTHLSEEQRAALLQRLQADAAAPTVRPTPPVEMDAPEPTQTIIVRKAKG